MVCALVASATFNTVTLTGFNRDIVSNGSAPALSTISASMLNGFDSAGYAMVAEDYNYAGYTPTYFLPTGGMVSSAITSSLNYQLADYSSNNALRLVNVGDNGTLAFVTPQSAGALYVLGTSASGDSYVDITVHFTDATTQVFPSVYLPDWYSSGGAVIGIGRVSVTDNHTEGFSDMPSLFENRLGISPLNYSKLVASVTIQKSSGSGYPAIMAISANSICSGSPTAGAINASTFSGCSEYSSDLSLTGTTSASGILYQWQSSATGTGWTSIPGATNATYTADVTTSTYYRAYVVCSTSGLADTAAPVELVQTATPPSIATLPVSESFESWIGVCTTADRPGSAWVTSPSTGDNSWRRDDQGDDASWDYSTDYMYTPASTLGAHSARFHSGYTHAGIVGNLDLHVNLSPAGTKQIAFDYINIDGSDFLTVQLSEDGGATFTDLTTFNTTTGWVTETLTTTSVAPNAVIRFAATADYGGSDIGIDNLLIDVLTPCSGTPVAGTFTSSQTTGCSEFTSNLALPLSSISGLTYQWQSSTDSATWTNVPGATDRTYTADVISNIYYRVMVTCTASGLSDATPGVLYKIVVPVATTATLPFFEGFESWMGTCFMFDRPGNNWLETPTSGNGAWRRDDQGADASWNFPSDYMYSPASTEGAHSARFHSGEATSGTEGDLDLHINLSAPGTKLIQFDYNNFDGTDYMDVQLSEDGGTTFTTLNTYTTVSSGNWAPEIITTTSTAANAVIRFRAISDFGGSDIGIDSLSISVEPTCSGAPVAGTFSADHTFGCTAYTANLSVDAPIYMTGIVYQWQSSPDGIAFTSIPGATNTTYAASVTVNTWYRFYVVCTASTLADTSASTEFTYTPVVPIYAALPYFQSFENWISGCYSFDRPDASWVLSPTSGNDSWRREDQGDDASWDYPTDGSYSPSSTDGSHSARFHTFEASSGDQGNMDLYINLSTVGTKQVKFDYNNTDGSDYLTVQLSEDGGATFTTLGTFNTTTDWMSETVTTSSTVANAIIRFNATSDFGFSDIGIDSVSVAVLPPCSGTPVAGTAAATVTSGCSAYSSDLSVTAPIYLSGITYQWQSSTTGTGFTNIAGATTSNYTASVASTTYYRFYVVCTVSGFADTSAAVALTVTPEVATPATLPYFQGFENWIGGCYSFDRPDSSWVLSPTTGDNSWRRDDQGSDASWDDEFSGDYSPTYVEGSHSARFHSYYANAGDIGNMSLSINLSTPGTKNISFYYNNADGSDVLNVYLSEDGGATFTSIGTYATTAGWERETLTTTSTASNAVIEFSAVSDFGNSDIGLDSLYITGPPVLPCNVATGLAASSITETSAVLSWDVISGAAGYQYVIDNSSSVPTSGFNFTTSTTYTDTSLICATTYYLHVRTDCSADSSAWATVSFTTAACSSSSATNLSRSGFVLEAYPNPAKETVNIKISGVMTGDAVLKLEDVTGKVIQIITLSGNTAVVDISQLASGIYFINYVDSINNRTVKVNKQ